VIPWTLRGQRSTTRAPSFARQVTFPEQPLPRLSDLTRKPAATQTQNLAGAAAVGAARHAATRGSPLPRHRRIGKHADEGHELSTFGGLAALSLDALSSVAYGPEAMVLVLVTRAPARCASRCR